MIPEEELLFKRFLELANRSLDSHYFIFTDFLGLKERDIFQKAMASIHKVRYDSSGGVPGCERIMIRFGDADIIGCSQDFPILCIKISPKSPKYAEKLTHRDYLGSILALGIERCKLGDIIIREGDAYLFAEEGIGSFVCESLEKVRHTDVKCQIISTEELPTGELFKTRTVRIQANGERIDAVIAKVFSLSRDDSSVLFQKGLVFIDGRECQSPSKIPKAGETVSVRGYGRFVYRGYDTLTRKGKKNIEVELFV